MKSKDQDSAVYHTTRPREAWSGKVREGIMEDISTNVKVEEKG